MSAETITHPRWCEPSVCNEDRAGGVLHDVTHWSPKITLTITVDGHPSDVDVSIARSDNYDGREPEGERIGRSNAYIDMSLAGDITLDELERLGAFLLVHASHFRQSIARENDERA